LLDVGGERFVSLTPGVSSSRTASAEQHQGSIKFNQFEIMFD
jgi:hypothetical protein